MTPNRIKLSYSIVLLLAAPRLLGQGCSDAGICTAGPLKPAHETGEYEKHVISFSLPLGLGDENVRIATPTLQYDYRLNKHWAVQAKTTGNYASGSLGSVGGAGDVFATAIWQKHVKKIQIACNLGVKVPLGNANLKNKFDQSLPMTYQATLGTWDVLSAVSIKYKIIQTTAGLQLPVSGANGNTSWVGLFNRGYLPERPPSYFLKRKPDLMLRSVVHLKKGEKWKVNAGLLAIYHLGQDSFQITFVNQKTGYIAIPGSAGLTLNVVAAASYRIAKQWLVALSYGMPVIVRAVRPDGLTRRFVCSPEIRYLF